MNTNEWTGELRQRVTALEVTLQAVRREFSAALDLIERLRVHPDACPDWGVDDEDAAAAAFLARHGRQS